MSSSHQVVSEILATNYSNNQRRLVSLPLQFADLPVDILAKQFTKLNSPHAHRIHYLGPRFVNTQHLHKKYAYCEANPICHSTPDRLITKYHLDYKKLVTSFSVNQRLRSNHHYKTGLYYRAFQGMNPTLNLNRQYVFDSAFQSGNLDCVIQHRSRQFDCFLRLDSNTRGHAQWFYFSIKNGSMLEKIKINICNITKAGTLYQQGMQPYFFSKKYFQLSNIGWKQGNHNLTNVNFESKKYNYQILQGKIPDRTPYCLSFQYEFQFENDEVFFAYCIPYSYSQMIFDIQKLGNCRIQTFAKSLSGIDIPLLIIGDQQNTKGKQLQKKNIFITGRTHPGQSNGSHMMKGFLQYICSQQSSAINLRKRATFFIIPMLNPDGVILGNSRSSAAGKDLNRVFPLPNQQIYPQAYQLRHMINMFLKHKKILMFFDFHGHSRRKNTFFYGPSYPITHPSYYKARVLPKIIETINKSFRFYSCSFSISEGKKTTARACMFQNFNIPFTYTVESSIGSYYDCEKLKTFTFDKQSWIKMGSSICEGLTLFIEAYEEYQQFINDRRAIREKKKTDKLFISRRSFRNADRPFFDDQEQCQSSNAPKSPLKIRYKGLEQGLFMKMLKQIKKCDDQKLQTSQGQKEKDKQKMDEDDSSDDHDENEDLQLSKMKQLNYLITQCADKKQQRQNKKQEQSFFVRSKNLQMTIKFNRLSQQNQQQDQMNFLQQNFLRKIQSSHSNQRPKYSPIKIRAETKYDRRMKIMKTNEFSQQKSYQNYLKSSTENNNKTCIRSQFSRSFKDDLISTARSNKTKNKTFQTNYKKNQNKMARFSEIQFPQEQMQQPTTSKAAKFELFRRVRRIRNTKQSASKQSSSLNCTQKVLQKPHQQPQTQPQPKTQLKTTNMTLKIQQLMSNLQNRSKMLKQSVKYKQSQKNQAKHNFIFPSSFHGIKNQINIKRQFKTSSHTPVREKIGGGSIDGLPFQVRNYFNS